MSQPPSVPVDALPGEANAASGETFVDYFAFNDDVTHYLPDGKSFVVIKVMTEGDRKKYQKETSRPLRFDQRTQQAIMQASLAEDRHVLLELALTGWNLQSRNERNQIIEPVPFDKANLRKFLDRANPKLVEEIELAVRKANPWLMADMTVEEIDKEIENLKEMREQAEEREKAAKSAG